MQSLITAANSSQLDTIALAWLANGATSFGLWVGEIPLVQRPHVARQPADLVAPVLVETGALQGELRVTGIQGLRLKLVLKPTHRCWRDWRSWMGGR